MIARMDRRLFLSSMLGACAPVRVLAQEASARGKGLNLKITGLKTFVVNAGNLNFIAFWRYGPNPEAATGVMFVLFSIGIAAAEAAVGLALIISIYRHYKTTNVERFTALKG